MPITSIFESRFRPFKFPELPKNFTLTHHTGAMGKEMNSLEGIDFSIKMGAQIIEFDVTFRPDGTGVIIHSAQPKENEGILLENALELVAKSDSVKVNLDIKSTKNLPEVDRLCEKFGLTERVFYTGVFEKWVETVKANSKIKYFLNHQPTPTELKTEQGAAALCAKIKNLGAVGLNCNHMFINKKLIAYLQNEGLLVSIWTANTKSQMKKCLLIKPDNITTRRPDIFEELKKNHT